MFKCWSCGTDYPDVPYATRSEAAMWEKESAGYAIIAKQKMLDNYRSELIKSYTQEGSTDEYQQGLLDGLRIAINMIGN